LSIFCIFLCFCISVFFCFFFFFQAEDGIRDLFVTGVQTCALPICLVLVAAGAGGHTGPIAGFAFVEEVRKFWDGPIVLGGAISTGYAIRAAEVLGADLAYLGTSLLACEESMAAEPYKNMVIDAGAEDIIPSNAITGVTANWLRQSLIDGGYDPDNMGPAAKVNFTDPQNDAKAWKNVWAAGQGVGAVSKQEPMAAIIARLRQEYIAALAKPPFEQQE